MSTSRPQFVMVTTLDPNSLKVDGLGLFKPKWVDSVWFKASPDGQRYVHVEFVDGDFKFLDMNEYQFMELVEAIDEADLD